MEIPNPVLTKDRYFGPSEAQKKTAAALYSFVRDLPIIAPHGHVDPKLFSDPETRFGSPTELFILPDHYILRMLYAYGIPLETLGINRLDGEPVETDHHKIWQCFADHFYLFRGTPSGIWLKESLKTVFDVDQPLNSDTAHTIYEHIQKKLKEPAFSPRALYDQFHIEVLCTTDTATDNLEQHRLIQESGWHGRILPTFRPDQLVDITQPGWRKNIQVLSDVCGYEINSYHRFIQALEERRQYFKDHGAVAADHATETAFTTEISLFEVEEIFQHALQGAVTPEKALLFSGHMLMEFARMSIEDGLVMQWHVGSSRNHNPLLYAVFGPDKGADIPLQTEFTRSIKPLLNRFGNDSRFQLILFTLDESAYARELAPLAGHYPALKLGPPWWFHDSLNGITRYFDQVMETAGLYNTVGFNDDTRAFLSIPVRHAVWRRMSANWVAGLLVRGIVDETDAQEMVVDLAYNLAKKAYRLEY
ncbi:MAG: glucuronate isomerase [Anaerolineaceae bacterium]|nr:glucuronate isomerase [Anaerolineaceae bacterium]